MTRKHFEAIANEISQIENMVARLEATLAICKAMRKFDTKFDQAKFIEACGV